MIRPISIATSLALLLATGCVRAEMQAPPPMKPEKATHFSLTDQSGASLSLDGGGPTIINFWATWCAPCVKELPLIERLHRAHRGEGLRVIGVNMKEAPELVASFWKTNGYTFPTVVDATGATADAYQVFGLPSTYFIDADGMIVMKHMGELTREIAYEGIALISPKGDGR